MVFTKYPQILEYVSNLTEKVENLDEIVDEAHDFAHCNGLVLRLPNMRDKSDYCQSSPLALFPSPFPSKLFYKALELQNAMSELYFRIAWDYNFLIEAHKEVMKTDVFIQKMLEMYQKIMNCKNIQKKTLVLQRADYMCDVSKNPFGELKQVEVNNIAAGMGSFGTNISNWHKLILAKLFDNKMLKNLPDNYPNENLAEGLYHAWLSMKDKNSIVLFVVEDKNQNQLDQRKMEYTLQSISQNTVKVIRLTLTECYSRLSVKGTKLYVDNKTRITVIYFRAGYTIKNYPTEDEWKARLLIEESDAIKAPWIGLQLANTKKIQQMLCMPGMVEKYFPNNSKISSKIRSTFVHLWGLDNPDDEFTKNIIETAKNYPEKFVLKSQNEGGGGNYFDDDMYKKLNSLSKNDLKAFILMERIQPLIVQNILIRPNMNKIKIENVISELGTFGYLFGDGLKVEKASSSGYFLRSKEEDVLEGGVSCGAAVIDSALLYE